MTSIVWMFYSLSLVFGFVLLLTMVLGVFLWHKKLIFNEYVSMLLMLLFAFVYTYSNLIFNIFYNS